MAVTVSVKSEQARFQDDHETCWVCFAEKKLPSKYLCVEDAKHGISIHSAMTQMNWSSLSRHHTTLMKSEGTNVIVLELLLEVDGQKTPLQRCVYTINT